VQRQVDTLAHQARATVHMALVGEEADQVVLDLNDIARVLAA
jgi:hypothetical protein